MNKRLFALALSRAAQLFGKRNSPEMTSIVEPIESCGEDPRTSREVADFNVGGVRLPRPFHLSRIGHIGINVLDIDKSLHFYRDLLGFRVSDTLDFGAHLPPEERPSDLSGTGFFLHNGGDHHSFVMFPPVAAKVAEGVLGEFPMEISTNQISWQAGGLAQVVNGNRWMRSHARRIAYSGRDIPGSNFHFYTPDDDGHMNEVFYGMEQIGWNGQSKPQSVREMTGYMVPPDLPHRSEAAEISALRAAGIDLLSGHIEHEGQAEVYDVEGVLLGRPFRIGKVGPIRLFVSDVCASLHFYRDLLGLTVTEEITWHGHRCALLRCTNEHHSLGLYPLAMREQLGLSSHSTLFSTGLQMRSYRQLRDAITFLQDRRVEIRPFPAGLAPGVDFNVLAIDPCGHAVELYFGMEQLGWDGRPRPAELRRKFDADFTAWPDQIDPMADTFWGEPFLGPLG